jgi:Rho termination factor, N-terminal domain
MNDALMIGIVLTLVFGAVIFYLYNRLSMTERKLGLFEGILTDIKIMMDSAPFSMAPQLQQRDMSEFEPSPEYLNAISGPLPLQKEDVEEVAPEDEYQQTLEQALEQAAAKETKESKDGGYRSLQIDDLSGQTSAIQVTKLSPDVDTMTIKELNDFAKAKNIKVPTGLKRKDLIEHIKKSLETSTEVGVQLEGPPLSAGAPIV